MTSSPETSDNIHKNYDYYDDPLFLSSSDQPLLQIVNTAFDGKIFLNWKNDVIMVLAAKNKECFVEGTLPKPEKTQKTYHQWIRCDLTVMKWIKHSLTQTIRDNISYVKSSRELCKLKKGWEDLDSFDPLPQCICGALDLCTCQLLKKMLDRENQAKLIQFLMGLNHSYETVKTSILSTEPLPPINKALGLLQRVERQKQISDAVEVLSEANAFASQRQTDGTHTEFKKQMVEYQTDNRFDKKCTNCHIRRHTKEECYRLKECTNCGKVGHIRDQCFRLRGSNYRNFRGRCRSNNIRYQGGNNGYKRGAYNVDVFDYDGQEFDNSPLDDTVYGSHFRNNEADASSPGKQILVDKEFVTGLVNNVMDKIMNANNKAVLSSSNFAGPFK